jgi:hypothetical protein
MDFAARWFAHGEIDAAQRTARRGQLHGMRRVRHRFVLG